MRIIKSGLMALGVATVLVVGVDVAAYAANGHSVLLGKSNSATATTTIKNTKGTAATFSAKAGTAPIKVSNSTKVPLLNADKLDDKHATDLQTTAFTKTWTNATSSSGTVNYVLPTAPSATYLVSYSVQATRTATSLSSAGSFTCQPQTASSDLPGWVRANQPAGANDGSAAASFTYTGDLSDVKISCRFTDGGAWKNSADYITTVTALRLSSNTTSNDGFIIILKHGADAKRH